MASKKELSDFLISSEKRAFKQVLFAVRDEEAALDIIQDAMIKLSESYGDRNINELPPLFTRIVQNCTKDWFRRQKVRNTGLPSFQNLGKTATVKTLILKSFLKILRMRFLDKSLLNSLKEWNFQQF